MRLLVPALLALSLIPATAGETPWQEVAPGVSLRLVSTGTVETDGRTLVGLEIDMPTTTKTYWRVPGETGIPTTVSLRDASGVLDHDILWPLPEVDHTADYTDYVYYGPTLLPIAVTPHTEQGLFSAEIVLGICSDICIPVRAEIDLPLETGSPDAANTLRLRQAIASVPIDWTEADGAEPIGDVTLDVDRSGLRVELDPSQPIDPDTILAVFADDTPLLGPATRDGAAGAVLPIVGRADTAALVGRSLTLYFDTPSGPYRLQRVVAPP